MEKACNSCRSTYLDELAEASEKDVQSSAELAEACEVGGCLGRSRMCVDSSHGFESPWKVSGDDLSILSHLTLV